MIPCRCVNKRHLKLSRSDCRVEIPSYGVAAERGGRYAVPSHKLGPSLLSLPTEIRLHIYSYLFDDLIEELSDNLFGAFWLYDHMYDYTGVHLDSHIGRTGLTPILRTCKQIYVEALSVLCERGNFLVNVLGEDDELDEERSSKRFSDGQRHLALVRRLRVNFVPMSDGTNDRFVARILRFLDLINHGRDLWSLEIRLDLDNAQEVGTKSWHQILEALSGLRMPGALIDVYLGDISQEVLSEEQLTLFLETIGA